MKVSEDLYISNNRIGDQGAEYISENCVLTKLYLSNSNIGDRSAKYLSKALKSENCDLTELDVA